MLNLKLITRSSQLYRGDLITIVALILIWSLFFWRALTPVAYDQASLVEGDFSGQFFAFGKYQFDRLSSGEVPLWNPYNNAGLPFVADTQSASFYPPRLLTILLTTLSGTGWTYNALQMEVIFHVLVYTIFTYIFLRRLFCRADFISVSSAFTAAIIVGYGGFTTGYPLLQVAILESAIWLPLALLGILEATRHHRELRLSWLMLTGIALGLSWMAGHPQTGWLNSYIVIAYWIYRYYSHRRHVKLIPIIAGIVIIFAVTVGIYAVQLFPGIEYLMLTARTDLGFDEKSGGLPYRDIIQIIFPGVISLWSPLFIGVSSLILASVGMIKGVRERIFWGGAALVVLILSFGRGSVLFHAAYNTLPGLNFFRGQERFTFLFGFSLAVLVGIGFRSMLEKIEDEELSNLIRRSVFRLLVALLLISGGLFISLPGGFAVYGHFLDAAIFSSLIVLLFYTVINLNVGRTTVGVLVISIVIFELFSVNIDGDAWESIPAAEKSVMSTPALVERIQNDEDIPFRVDAGFGGAYEYGNSGTLYRIPEMRGISPLFLSGPHAIIQRESPVEVAWEIFAVRYVLTDAEELRVPSEIIGRDYPDGRVYNLHRLSDPRPFAHVVTEYIIAQDDRSARLMMSDPDFDLRNVIILHEEPSLPQTDSMQSAFETSTASVIDYTPESFTIQVYVHQPSILSISHVEYSGWIAFSADGEQLDVLRAYGGVTAIALPQGDHLVTFKYRPRSFYLGAGVSIFTCILLLFFCAAILLKRGGRESS